MPQDAKEPQSYGSQADWATGRTGEKVNEPKSAPPAEHADFYDERRDEETTTHWQGGRTSDVQLEEHANLPQDATRRLDITPTTGVTVREGGAKRGSYFRRRDY
jgi:hypothetical protein